MVMARRLWSVAGGVCAAVAAHADPCAARWAEGFDTYGMDGGVLTLSVADVGEGPRLFAAGTFSTAGSEFVNRIAMWDGRGWHAMNDGVDSSVFALSGGPSGGIGPDSLYAGGNFLTAGGESIPHLARWDGASWHAVGGGVGGVTSPFITALLRSDVSGADALYVGGSFLDAGGAPASYVARWDGSAWSALGAGLSDRAQAFTVYDDGRGPALYAGGRFLMAGGIEAARVARWDGASWEALGAGVGGLVNTMAVYDDGRGRALYVGGSFSSAGGAPAQNLARWDGAAWEDVAGGTLGLVYSLAVFDDRAGEGPALYVGGRFDVAGGVIASRIARWNGASWSMLASGLTPSTPGKGAPSGSARAIIAHDDGSGPGLFAGGEFILAGGEVAQNIARWYVPRGCCPGDANVDLRVDMLDLNIVLGEFGMAGPGLHGDVTRDGRVDFRDLVGVLGLFGSSCLPND